jgi:hypothetical protein
MLRATLFAKRNNASRSFEDACSASSWPMSSGMMGLRHSDKRGVMFRNTEWIPSVQWSRDERMAVGMLPADGRVLAVHLPDHEP